MPWKECTMISERKQFVSLALEPSVNMSQLCRGFGMRLDYRICPSSFRFSLGGLRGQVPSSSISNAFIAGQIP